jgi:hypothetical protein
VRVHCSCDFLKIGKCEDEVGRELRVGKSADLVSSDLTPASLSLSLTALSPSLVASQTPALMH